MVIFTNLQKKMAEISLNSNHSYFLQGNISKWFEVQGTFCELPGAYFGT